MNRRHARRFRRHAATGAIARARFGGAADDDEIIVSPTPGVLPEPGACLRPCAILHPRTPVCAKPAAFQVLTLGDFPGFAMPLAVPVCLSCGHDSATSTHSSG